MRVFQSLFRLLPHQCQLCFGRSDTYLCHACLTSLPRNLKPCLCCALPLQQTGHVCGDCLKQPKPYQLTVSPLLYHYPLNHLIKRFKQHQPLQMAQVLLPPLLQALPHYYEQDWPECLVPMPMHWHKQWQRGFNQAQVLALLISQHTGIEQNNFLARPYALQNQKGLTRKQRFRNLNNALSCHSDLSGRHVVVVDDVVTTCASAMAAATALRHAGAARVDIWSLARTP